MTEEMKKKIHSGIEMFSDKIEKVAREKKEWSICELGCVADMVKDLATAYEKMAKAHYYLSEHSEEKY